MNNLKIFFEGKKVNFVTYYFKNRNVMSNFLKNTQIESEYDIKRKENIKKRKEVAEALMMLSEEGKRKDEDDD